MTAKADLKKELDCYRATRDRPRLLTVPDLQYLMIDGAGDPNTEAFAEAITTLYPLAYAVKFLSKVELQRDYVVMPLEGLWWSDDMATFTSARDKSRWQWTLAVMTPEWITGEHVAAALERVAAKKAPARLGDVRLENLSEGRCVQALHVGSFDDEAELLRRMHDEYIPGHGLTLTGKHHEIYLSDFRRVEPARCRTILRQPVRTDPGDDEAGRIP
ncbi:GyrI-like domain-containing protein [Actinomycetospora atypica]|uniref:GyrI-like domain-containing protein n=1 Tax=Actinomycetospora atypica TaxID=1290095 RepID=A0ABV9YGW1_9PSEU